MGKSQATAVNAFFNSTFLHGRIYILFENIFGKSLYCYICMTVFSRVKLLEMQ